MCDGGDCRCKVSLRSYSPSNVELGLRNANFWGFELIFLWGKISTNFRGCSFKLHPDRILCQSTVYDLIREEEEEKEKEKEKRKRKHSGKT